MEAGWSNEPSASDKSLIRGDVLIGDRPKTCENWPGPVVMLETHANRGWPMPEHKPHIRRARNWKQVIDEVVKILW